MRVRFTPNAYRQIAEIFAYIARDNASAAGRVKRRIEFVAELLGDNPEMGRTTTGTNVRMLPVSPYPYLIFYKVKGEEVRIVGVYHGARRRPAFHEPAHEFQL